MPNPFSPTESQLNWGPTVIAALDAAYDKGNTVFSVKDFGAVGDGVTDDTAAIQSTITAASATHGIVFFPPGTFLLSTFTGTGIGNRALTLTTGITVQGTSYSASVLKVAGTVTSFFTVFGATDTSVDLTGLTIRDLGFNMNTTAIAASSGQVAALDYRAAVVVYNGSRITFRNNRIFDSCGVWGFTVNTSSSTGVAIEDNIFEWATSTVFHDTSAIYTSVSRALIRGNRFTSTAGTPLAFTAIETHGNDHIITNNIISGWYRGINLTGVGLVSTNLIFSHNTITQCAVGVELWSTAGQLTGGYGLVNASINDNNIDVDYDSWPSATIAGPKSGIMLNLASDYGVKNLDIRNNQINWRTITTALVSGDLSSSGIALYRASGWSFNGTATAGAATTITTALNLTYSLAGYTISTTGGTGSGQSRTIASNTTGANSVVTVTSSWGTNPDATTTFAIFRLITDQGITISGNKIIGSAGPGIYLQPKSVASQVRIDTNTITNPASNAATYPTTTYRAGIKLDGLTGNSYEYRDTTIDRNQILDNRGTALITSGIHLSALTVPVTNGRVVDNVLRVADGTAVALVTSSTAAGTRFRREQSIGFTTGAYYGPQGTRSTFATTLSQMTATPFFVSASQTFDRLGAEVTVLGATSVVRLGIYADNGYGQPGDLVVDGGTIDASTTGAKEVTINQPLQAGLYWLAGCIQTAASTVRIVQGALPPVAGSTLAGGTASTAPNGYYSASITGAFPSQFSVTGTTTGANLVVIRST